MTEHPTSVAELRAHRSSLPPVREFKLEHWLNSARDLLNKAAIKWGESRGDLGGGRGQALAEKKAVEAYKDNKRAAEILQLVTTHPDFKRIMSTRSPENELYSALKHLVFGAIQTNKDIVGLLELREREWNESEGRRAATNGASKAPPPSTTHASSNAAQSPPVTSPALSDEGFTAFLDSYTSPRSPPQQSASPPPAPVSSVAQRMAALRAAGMKDEPLQPKRNSAVLLPHAAPLPSPTTAPPASSFFASNYVPESPKLQQQILPSSPRIPRKPAALSVGRSPPASPSQPTPPVLPRHDHHLDAPPPSRPPAPAPIVNGRHDDLDPDFGSQFPSLDELEALDVENGRSDRVEVRRPLPIPQVRDEGRRNHSSGEDASVGPVIAVQLPTTRPKTAPPVAQTTERKLAIPFTNEVLPNALYTYLVQAIDAHADEGRVGPRVLLLDVRSREEFDQGRILGEAVCIEPLILRPGSTSSQLESSLTLSPPLELELFASRHHYDLVIIYDRSSTSMPPSTPPSTSPEAQRTLWNLQWAIYDQEFSKNLKRQPVLLKGGWEAWEREVGRKGIVGGSAGGGRENGGSDDVGRSRNSLDEFGRLEAKRANRKASVSAASGNEIVVRNGAGNIQYDSPYNQPSTVPGYFSPPPQSNYASGFVTPYGAPLALPPTAVQRSGHAAPFDPYAVTSPALSSTSNYSYNRPSYPQPEINGLMSPSGSQHSLLPVLSSSSHSSLPSRQNDYGMSTQSYGNYSSSPRTPISYPQLQQARANPPPIPQSSRPPLLTRPPAVQPAPERSNNSFSVQQYNQVSSLGPMSPSKFAVNGLPFDDDAMGLTGLKNLGNTCYMNSILQCLSATIPFARYFRDGTYKRDVNLNNHLGTKGALANAVAELIRAMWAQNYTFLSPVTFRDNICRFAPQFRGSDQHDAQEFLGFLLDGLHEDLNYVVNKPKPIEMSPAREEELETLPQQIMSEKEWEIYRMRNDSFVVQNFQGQFRNQMKCLTCGKTSTTYNTFMPLSIPVPSGKGITKVSLDECIRSFVREEILEKDDAWFCPRCKTARKASKKLSLSRLPPILVIHLKRFSFKGPFSDKIETQVMYPLQGLDLTSFVPPPLFDPKMPPLRSSPKGHVYDLYGVTNHYGNLSSGHYTAYVRKHQEWNNVGDSKYTPVQPHTVESNRNSYILWYRKS